MKTGPETLQVDSTPVAPDGSKLEPEERAARESFGTPVGMTVADHAVRPDEVSNPVGSMRGMVGIDSTAGDVAQDVATRCELCQHWRRADWMKHLSAIEGTHEGRQQLNALRGELLGRNDTLSISDDDMTAVDLAIRHEFGICAAFTETEGMPVASPFYGGCPAEDPRFKMRDRSAQVQSSSRYDTVMRLAQGKGQS